MNKRIISMLFFILAVLLVTCLNVFSLNKEELAVDVALFMCDSDNADHFDKVYYSFFSDAEQNSNSQNVWTNTSRLKRIIVGDDTFFFMLIQRHSGGDRNSFNYPYTVYSNSNGFLSQSVIGYYVFALRHIIV
ncbi:hypothetical protein [uncultured Bacteroides sp.]|uniref:hypothetical protein n=1 Tax=uncultured Bacteroides sp. TaxID=162156 RepID=UPI002AABB70D|nr:hypothetical protein [uncultured Bacteroides sp.]